MSPDLEPKENISYVYRGKIISARKRDRLIAREERAYEHRMRALDGGSKRERRRRLGQIARGQLWYQNGLELPTHDV